MKNVIQMDVFMAYGVLCRYALVYSTYNKLDKVCYILLHSSLFYYQLSKLFSPPGSNKNIRPKVKTKRRKRRTT